MNEFLLILIIGLTAINALTIHYFLKTYKTIKEQDDELKHITNRAKQLYKDKLSLINKNYELKNHLKNYKKYIIETSGEPPLDLF